MKKNMGFGVNLGLDLFQNTVNFMKKEKIIGEAIFGYLLII